MSVIAVVVNILPQISNQTTTNQLTHSGAIAFRAPGGWGLRQLQGLPGENWF